MIVRLSKALLVLMIALFALMVGIDNIIDYDSNFVAVQHVMSMDTTFPDSALRWRAVTHSLGDPNMVRAQSNVSRCCCAALHRFPSRNGN